jgi:hypothetical protein
VQAHVQERIRLARVGREVAAEGLGFVLQQRVVFRMLLDDCDDLVLERLERRASAMLAPRRDVEATQSAAILVVEEWHGSLTLAFCAGGRP